MNDRLLVSTRKGLFVLRRGSSGWRMDSTSFLGDPVTNALADARDCTLHAALDLGHFGVKYRRSRDGGAHWHELTPPQYPPKPDDCSDIDPFRRKPVPWSTVLLWELAAGGADEPGVLWAGTIPGGLFRSEDGGEHWELQRSLWERPERQQWSGGGFDFAGVHSVCVDPRDSQHVTIGVSTGGVWTTRDGGETWQIASHGMRAAYMPPGQEHDPVAQDVHRLVQSRSRPDVFWAQHHNGIFRSTDGAASWHEIEDVQPSVFGFAVVVHPRDADRAWFVPAKKDECRVATDGRVVVNRTDDGGKSFTTLRNGLPQEHAYDLVFRHALDIDASGERLAFGSTTGSLWISENQGENWQLLNAHLPPIHSVRFG